MSQHVGVSKIQTKQTTSKQSHTNTNTFAKKGTLLLRTIICCQKELIIMSQQYCFRIRNSNKTNNLKTVTHKHTHLCPFSHPSPSHDHLLSIGNINYVVSTCWRIKTSHKHNNLCHFSHPSSSHDHLKEIN